MARFEREFAPVRHLALTENQRATRRLVELADRVAASFAHRATRLVPSPRLAAGEPVVCRHFGDPGEEARWIAGEAGRLAAARNRGGRSACSPAPTAGSRRSPRPCRGGRRARDGGAVRVLPAPGGEGRPRSPAARAEPDDAAPLQPGTAAPGRGIGPRRSRRWSGRGAGGPAPHRTSCDPARPRRDDPFAPPLDTPRGTGVVVLDLETTGLDPARDEVIELGAVRLQGGREAGRLHRFSGRAGRSATRSRCTAAATRSWPSRHGRGEVLREFQAFAGAELAGHNVAFDRPCSTPRPPGAASR